MTFSSGNCDSSSEAPIQVNSSSLVQALAECDLPEYVVVETTDFAYLATDFVSSGSTVVVYQCCNPSHSGIGMERDLTEDFSTTEAQEGAAEESSCVLTLRALEVGKSAAMCPRLERLMGYRVSTCQTVACAVKEFSQTVADTLVIGRFLVLKPFLNIPSALIFRTDFSDLSLAVYTEPDVPTPIRADSLVTAISELRKATGSVVVLRTELPLYREYLDWLHDGRKVTTIRFRLGAVELAGSSHLPLYETGDFSVDDRSKPAGYVKITSARYQRFCELSTRDAERDGFKSIVEMRQSLRQIYPRIEDRDWMTVYDIQLDS